MENWRLLDTGVRTAAENMALDEVVLTAKGRGWAPNTLRFLQFSPHCTLVGYHQSVEQEIRIEYCRDNGIDINRRITGGGGLYWDETQLGWEIFANKNHPAIPTDIEELYKKLCNAVIFALSQFGLQAKFRYRNDIEINHRKISGTGGTELDNAFLFQGTLLVDFDVDTMLRALRIPTEKLKDKEIESVKERVTCLKWELGYVPAVRDIKAAIVQGFAHELGVTFTEGPLLQKEEELLIKTLPKFLSSQWVDNIRRSRRQRQELKSLYKNEGGLIRTSVILDGYTERIQAILITGDFFVYPKNSIFDLENLLRDVPADFNQILAIIKRFFVEKRVNIPGLTPKDFGIAIWDAVKKKDLLNYGIRMEDINSVYTVGGQFEQVNNATVLLLPYCAKKTSCNYRFKEGCVQCGRCTVGPAFKLAFDYGLRPVTIQNYEMLEETLTNLKKEGVPSFVGTCCDAFYAKHKDDFERIGLPGVLVDVENSTCYDLGKEKEAKEGRFENQTELKLDLLKQIVDLKAGMLDNNEIGGGQ